MLLLPPVLLSGPISCPKIECLTPSNYTGAQVFLTDEEKSAFVPQIRKRDGLTMKSGYFNQNLVLKQFRKCFICYVP